MGSAFPGNDVPNIKVIAEGHSATDSGQDSITVGDDGVSDNYFQTMDIPLLRGRNFSEQDPQGHAQVAVINEMMAQRLWPGEDPVGKRFGTGLPGQAVSPTTTVIGVVGNTLRNGRESDVVPMIYTSARQLLFWTGRRLVVRTVVDPKTLVAPIREVIRSMDKTIPKIEITSIEEALSNLDATRKFQLQVLSSFSVIALILAVVGIYGILSYSVEQRTREIGLRMALGAQPAVVVRLVIAQGMKPILIGLGIGLIGALTIARIMKSLLYQVPATDPATFAGIAAMLVVVGFIAAYLPARRAARVDPTIALRWE